jgi:hypothetical protein
MGGRFKVWPSRDASLVARQRRSGLEGWTCAISSIGREKSTTPSRSAWTARAHGETTFLSSASGEPSSTRKSICVPMMASKKHGNQSTATSPSTTQGDLTQPLTAAPRIKPTLTRCRSARQHNPRPTIHLTTRKFFSKDRGHFTPPRSTGDLCDSARCATTCATTAHLRMRTHPRSRTGRLRRRAAAKPRLSRPRRPFEGFIERNEVFSEMPS